MTSGILLALLLGSFVVNPTAAQQQAAAQKKMVVRVGDNGREIVNFLQQEKYPQVLYQFSQIPGQSHVGFQVHDDFSLCLIYEAATGIVKSLQIYESPRHGKQHQFGLSIDHFSITEDGFVLGVSKKK